LPFARLAPYAHRRHFFQRRPVLGNGTADTRAETMRLFNALTTPHREKVGAGDTAAGRNTAAWATGDGAQKPHNRKNPRRIAET